MATMTDESVELDVDTTSDVRCQLDPCQNVAEYTVVHHCPARHSYIACEPCVQEMGNALERYKVIAAVTGGTLVISCDICPDEARLVPPYFTWRKL